MTHMVRVPAGLARTRLRWSPLAVALVAGTSGVVVLVSGGSQGWRVLRVAAVVAAAVAVAQLPGRWRWRAAVLLGGPGIAVGAAIAGPHATKAGFTTTTVAGAVVLAASLLLLVAGGVALLRTRVWWRGVLAVLAGLALAALTLPAIAISVAVTNVPPIRPQGPTPADVGLHAEDVVLITADGVELAAWYVPSRNGAAVAVLHGAGSTRSDVLPHGAVLARRGFGVLLVDTRGHGDSGGRAMDLGWYGDADVSAAVGFLRARADVDGDRIGLVGLSMGGEQAIGGAAATPVRAVVAEGATSRTADDVWWLSDEHGLRGSFQELLNRAQTWLTDLLTAASPPTSLRAGIERSDASFLLIAAGDVADEIDAAAHLAARAPERVRVWTVPEAGHTDGLVTDPVGWEERVVGFLTAELLG